MVVHHEHRAAAQPVRGARPRLALPGGAERHREPERAAPPRLAVHADRPAHRLGELLGRSPAPGRCRRSGASSSCPPARTTGTAAPAPPARCRCRCRSPPPAAARRDPSAGSRRTRTDTPPSSVNFSALATRFTSTCRSRPGSPRTTAGTSGWIAHASSRPLACARSASRSRLSSIVVARSNSMDSSSSWPASIFEKSRMSLMMVSSASPELAHRLRVLALLRRQRRVEQQPRHADHPVHRRPDLVAHRGQELALRPARRLGRVPRLPQLLLRALVRGDVAVRRHEAAPAHRVVLDLEDAAVGQRPLDPAGLELARLGHPLRDPRRRVARADTRRAPRPRGRTPRGAAPPTRSPA